MEHPLEYEALLTADLSRPLVHDQLCALGRDLNRFLMDHNDAMHFTYLRPFHFYGLSVCLSVCLSACLPAFLSILLCLVLPLAIVPTFKLVTSRRVSHD